MTDLATAPSPPASTVRRRLDALVDPCSFVELGSGARHRCTTFGMAGRRPAGDGVVTGPARVDGRAVGVFAQDPGVLGGSLGELHADKVVRLMEWAARSGAPVVGLLDSGGARIQEGVGALDGYGRVFRANVGQSGRIPQVSVVLGACAGGAVYSPALTDVVIMARSAHMFLTGPRVVKAVTAEDVSAEALGGVDVHATLSGVVHLEAADEDHALELARRVLSYLPSSCWAAPPPAAARGCTTVPSVPADHRKPYDVRHVVAANVDDRTFLELHERFAPNIVVGFARIDGAPVGVVGNQPMVMAGTIDIRASEKAARFVRTCDAFGIPLLTLVDTPGFLPGTHEEHGGVIRRGAKLLHAYAEATVPRVTVVLRKAFGGAYIVMGSRALGADAVYAWPDAELGVMGADGAVDIVFRRELSTDPGQRADLMSRYRSAATAVERAAERMSVDEIVAPERTRGVVAATLRSLAAGNPPRYRHDNLPQ